MLSANDLFDIQSTFKVSETNAAESAISIREYMDNCEKYVTAHLPKEYSNGTWSTERKNQERDARVRSFVLEHIVRVEGFLTEQGELNAEQVITYLINTFRGEGVLRDALDDPNIDEIQIRDKDTIFVFEHGVKHYCTDKQGNPIRFPDNEAIERFVIRICDDGTGNAPNFTVGAPILNAKTARQQYRLNAVHNSLNAREKGVNAPPITTVTIRKFPEHRITLNDLVRSKTITKRLSRLLSLLGRVKLNVFFVGETGSGKTTLLQAVAQSIPRNQAMILIQNPTEITFFDRDEYGRNKRNVIHWEAQDNLEGVDNKSKTNGTVGNLLATVLRNTPDVLILGEVRHPDEFADLASAGRQSIRLLGTFHADSAKGAIARGADALGKYNHVPESSMRTSWAEVANIIVVQKKWEDDKADFCERKISEITEVLLDADTGKITLQPIVTFETAGVKRDKNGQGHLCGRYVQKNAISQRLKQGLVDALVPDEEYAEFLTVADMYEEDELPEYDLTVNYTVGDNNG